MRGVSADLHACGNADPVEGPKSVCMPRNFVSSPAFSVALTLLLIHVHRRAVQPVCKRKRLERVPTRTLS